MAAILDLLRVLTGEAGEMLKFTIERGKQGTGSIAAKCLTVNLEIRLVGVLMR